MISVKPGFFCTVLFPMGVIVGTPGAIECLERSQERPAKFLMQHVAGNWGSVCDEDKALNDQALVDGDRLLSAYETALGDRLWVITEADRSATTILLPSEY